MLYRDNAKRPVQIDGAGISAQFLNSQKTPLPADAVKQARYKLETQSQTLQQHEIENILERNL